MNNQTHHHNRRATVSHTESEFDGFELFAQNDDGIIDMDPIMEEDQEFVDALMQIPEEELCAPEDDPLGISFPMADAVAIDANTVDMEVGEWDGRTVSTSSSFDHYSIPLLDSDIVCSRGIYASANHPGNVTMRRIIARNVVPWGKATTSQQVKLLQDIRREIELHGAQKARFLFAGTRQGSNIFCREASENEIEKEIKDELLLHFNVIPKVQDYIFGMGKPTYNWQGNMDYRRDIIFPRVTEYKSQATIRAGVRQEVMNFVAQRGGQFLYPYDNARPTQGCIVVENQKDIQDKLDRVLRDSKGGHGNNAALQADPPHNHNGPHVHHIVAFNVVEQQYGINDDDDLESKKSSTLSATIPTAIEKCDSSVASSLDGSPLSSKAIVSWRAKFILAAIIVVVLVVTVVAFVLTTGSDETSAEPGSKDAEGIVVDASVTLSAIRQRGHITCGVALQQGYGSINDQGDWEGFEIDLCRAVAAVIFGKDRLATGRGEQFVRFIPLDAGKRFATLDSEEIDLLLAITSNTMERNVFEASTKKGYTFSKPYLVNSLVIAGLPDFLPCAMSGNSTMDEICRSAKLCVIKGTTHAATIASHMPDYQGYIVVPLTLEEFYENFKSDDCNLLAGEQFDVAQTVLENNGYSGPYEVGNETLTRELISLVTREGDVKFSDFVNHILQSLMTAEEVRLGVAPVGFASDLDAVFLDAFPVEGELQDAYDIVGDIGELYDKWLGFLVPRSQANQINLGTSAAMYPIQLGTIETDEPPSEVKSPTIEAIQQRGYLVVGITDAPIFAQLVGNDFEGLDVDFGKAISASLFDGIVDTVQYKVISGANRFKALDAGDVDLLARVTTITPERDIEEPTTRKGFTFSTPTFYDSIRFVGQSQYVLCAENKDWTSAVCSDLMVCLTDATTQYNLLSKIFPNPKLLVTDSSQETVEVFARGDCNVFAAGFVERSPSSIEQFYSGEYEFGSKDFSRESLALVTREDDEVFSKVVNAVVNAILYADENEIHKESYLKMPRMDLFRPLIGDTWMRNVIRAVGSYQEIWDRHAGSLGLEREGRNRLNVYPFEPMLITDQTWDRQPPDTP